MAAQITHVALAERVFDTYFYKFNRRDFIIGTLFPDIRLMGHIPRELTHFKRVGIQDVVNEKNSFMAGMLYHSLVDMIREEWMVGQGIYELMPREYRWTQAIKFFEDRFFYTDTVNWEVVSHYFNTVLPEELHFQMERPIIETWHRMLRNYLSTSPTTHTMIQSISDAGLDEQIGIDIDLHIQVIEKNSKIISLCNEFKDNYENIIKNVL